MLAFPSKAGGNVYLNGALEYIDENNPLQLLDADAVPQIVEEATSVFLMLAIDPTTIVNAAARTVTTARLGKTQVSELGYDNYDGAPLTIDKDYFGKPRTNERPLPRLFESLAVRDEKTRVW